MVNGKGKTIYAGNASKNYLQGGFKIGIFPQNTTIAQDIKNTFLPNRKPRDCLVFFFCRNFSLGLVPPPPHFSEGPLMASFLFLLFRPPEVPPRGGGWARRSENHRLVGTDSFWGAGKGGGYQRDHITLRGGIRRVKIKKMNRTCFSYGMFRMFLGVTKYGEKVRVSISVYINPGESFPFGVPGKKGGVRRKAHFTSSLLF